MTAPTEPTAAPAAPAQTTQPAAPNFPTPAQVFPTQQPAPQPTAPTRLVGEHGFPESTPLVEMTAEQREAYWRHHARRHEDTVKARADYDELKAKAAEFDKLQAAQMSEQQRAVAEAEQRARTAVLGEAGPKAAEAALRIALQLAKGLDKTEVDRIVGPLNCNYFLAADGMSVDTDKVTAYLTTIAAPPVAPAAVPPAPVAPATGVPQPRPDMGQGNRTVTASGGLAAGAERAKARIASRQAPPVIAK